VIDDGLTGLLFQRGNIHDAVEKASRLLSDAQLYDNLRRAALRSVEQKFNADRIIRQYEDLYLNDT